MIIKNREILDDIIRQLQNDDMDLDHRTFANYDDGNIYIEACVKWIIESYYNYIDGYLEGVYDEVVDWEDLEIDAWVGDEKADVDWEYIEANLF